MEYSANSNVKQAMERAHAERSQALFSALSWLFRSRKSGVTKTADIGFSRWA
ncbi:hypothetical protein [Pseudophaeobacter sp. EL27]|uniref:hypothetical protein n=1 Tax=Pseudophaeobacter sp. EL27 TaxID=2107580 RepID=UPI0013C3F6C0|nr:hypothetical protein [Pseudophaeobacter sp. EL27]